MRLPGKANLTNVTPIPTSAQFNGRIFTAAKAATQPFSIVLTHVRMFRVSDTSRD